MSLEYIFHKIDGSGIRFFFKNVSGIQPEIKNEILYHICRCIFIKSLIQGSLYNATLSIKFFLYVWIIYLYSQKEVLHK